MPHSPRILDQAFALIECAAINGERCPTRDFLESSVTTALARAGRITIEISGRNWRTVTILTGPHAGKTTKPDPFKGHVYQTIGLTTAWTPKAPHLISRVDRERRLSRATRNLYRSDFQPT